MMSNKRILPSIGLEGTKEELLEFLSDFEINKIAISFVDNQMIFTTSEKLLLYAVAVVSVQLSSMTTKLQQEQEFENPSYSRQSKKLKL